jgi:hypothetical protein
MESLFLVEWYPKKGAERREREGNNRASQSHEASVA